MEESGPLNISFEDLVGVTYDHPALRLPEEMRLHTGPLCRWAKQHVIRPRGLHACSANKYLGNRKVLQQRCTITGTCHMGLTDICHPLIYREQIMGIFYFGSVLLENQVAQSRQNIKEVCLRQRIDSTSALKTLEKVPVISLEQLADYQIRLREMTQIVVMIMDGLGLPADCYRPSTRASDARTEFPKTPRLVVRAIRIIALHYDQPLRLATIARRLNCHPTYLGRVFRKTMGVTVAQFLERTRVERACRLLQLGRLDVTRIAYEVGYTDKSNFGRSFRKIMGVTPGEYRIETERNTLK